MATAPSKSAVKKSTKASSKTTTTKPATTKPATTKPTKKVAKPTADEVPPPPPQVDEKNVVSETQQVSSIAPDSTTIESSLTENLVVLAESIQSMTAILTKIKGDYKALEKQVLREARSMDKVIAKRKKSKGSRAPSGFVKPTAISKDLAKFLGVADDAMMARTDVTKLITAYVKEHKLQAPDNGRKILPDKKLMALLASNPTDEVTYFNLQKYMKPHFIKKE
jgi:upstream activation factor subunit UAF30